jgi:asparagine synthase (glutamine-hydrolysing)
MAGIAGFDRIGKRDQVAQMLEKLAHRGKASSRLIESDGVTLGAVWPKTQAAPTSLETLPQQVVWDASRLPSLSPKALEQAREPFALAAAVPHGLFLARGPLGVRPLYYGRTDDGAVCFASEVKALIEATHDIHEFPPGSWYDSQAGFQAFAKLEPQAALSQDSDEIASGLRSKLEQAVQRRVDSDVMGCWLSGGLDSSAMAALARPHVRKLYTFSAGLSGAPDLDYARQVADFLGTEHHEVVVTVDDLLAALPEVIYHLESFDALLVRSSITNYLVARRAADYVGSVFSGEGGDELFAGYDYLKELAPDQLPDELVDIARRMHNTALQRVDRSARAHGLVAHIPFLDADVVAYARRIPPELKLRRNGDVIEKWIVRRALTNRMPYEVLWRRKAKFWQGAGVGELLAQLADKHIADDEFSRERTLPNGWMLNTKEELMYYRIFKQYFGELHDLSWMGRTKGAPTQRLWKGQ